MGYLDDIKPGAIAGWRAHQILPSLTGAQSIIESGWGKSKLAQPPYNNQFGIKSSPDWNGRNVNMPTREWGPNGYYWINADFRAYDTIAESVKDHAAFFSNTDWRRNNYRAVIGEKDYKKACRAVQSAGYATDPGYANSLIRIIEENKLYEWDKEAFEGSVSVESTNILVQQTDKTTGGNITEAGKEEAKKLEVTLIGDSLGVGTQPYLINRFSSFNYDVRGSRQITHSDTSLNGTRALEVMKDAGSLKKYIVVILGTNRGVTQNEIDNFVSIAGENRKILFVDTASEVSHRSSVSREYYAASIRHKNVYYVDWSKYAIPYITQYYSADGANGSRIHMTSEGYKKHADYIVQAVYEASAGNFEGRTAQFTTKQYYGIENIEYEYQGLYSPKGQSVIYNAEANERWGFRAGDGGKTLWIDGLLEIPGEKVGGALMTAAEKYMLEHSKPAVQYTVHLSELPNDISIGDRGVFVDHYFNPPLAIEATVIEISTSDTDPTSNKVVVGNVVELKMAHDLEIERVRQELKITREEIIKEYRKGAPVELNISASNGFNLYKLSDKTSIYVKALQNGFDITNRLIYLWERYTSDTQLDNEYNTPLRSNHRSPHFDISHYDLVNKNATFIVRAYDNAGNLVAMTGADIKLIEQGKSAYQSWLDIGNRGTESEFIDAIKGRDGKDGVGIPGAPGQDGRTSYIHTAYADGTQGENFTTGEPGNRSYIGTYTDHEAQDSNDYTRYRWLKFKGDDGAPGQDGAIIYRSTHAPTARVGIDYLLQSDGKFGLVAEVKDGVITKFNNIIQLKGSNGQTSYIHTAFADSEDGTVGFSTTDKKGKKYMGFYTDFTETPSTSPSIYKWIKMAEAYAEEFKVELDNKANQRETDEYLNNIRGELQKTRQAQEALASSQEVSEVVKAVQLLRKEVEKDQTKSAESLRNAIARLAKYENDLGEFALRLNFINLSIQASEEGLIIGDKTKGTYVLQRDDRIGFFNNGVEVAFITGGMLQITQAIFVERIQIGAYMLGAYENDKDILAIRYVGSVSR